MKKRIVLLVLVFACILAACGKQEGLDGTWVLTKKSFADGTVLKGDDVGSYESYVVNGAVASYTCNSTVLGKKNFNLQVEQTGEDEYEFRISETIIFAKARLDGDTLSYVLGEGDQAVTFIFERQ